MEKNQFKAWPDLMFMTRSYVFNVPYFTCILKAQYFIDLKKKSKYKEH